MKSLHEDFTKFFENPTREKFKEIIQYNTGEYNNLDFKKEWPETSKLAKHILAFANSGGGVIVIGIEETEKKELVSCGIESITDKAIINSQLSQYVPNGIEYTILDFTYASSDYSDLVGKSFQVVIVEYDPKLIPFISLKEGKSIKENAIYIRQGTSSILASYEQLQKLLNNRIATNYNTSSEIELEEHLSQLKVLYGKIEKYRYVYTKTGQMMKNIAPALGIFAESLSKTLYGEKETVPNPNYPDEDYEEFIAKLIKKKKARIEALIDV